MACFVDPGCDEICLQMKVQGAAAEAELFSVGAACDSRVRTEPCFLQATIIRRTNARESLTRFSL